MAVNYTIESLFIAAGTGYPWSNIDVYIPPLALSGVYGTIDTSLVNNMSNDGTPSNGMVPIRMAIVPNEGYVVSASDFTIQEQEPIITINTPSINIDDDNETFNLLSSGDYVDLRMWNADQITANPDIVQMVMMHDSATPGTVGNYVVVYAFLDPNWEVPEGGQVLDIDGAAVQIGSISSGGDIIVSDNNNQRQLSLEMDAGADSNCIVVPYIPPSLTPTSSQWQYQSNQSQNQSRAWFTWNPGSDMNNIDSQPLFPPSSGTLSVDRWFWIIPKEGYTLSRHNLYFSTTDVSNVEYTWSDVDGGDNLTYYANSNVNIQANDNLPAFPPNETYPRCITIPAGVEYPDEINDISAGVYATTSWSNVYVEFGGSNMNINDIQNMTIPPMFAGVGNIILADITDTAPSLSEAAAATYFPGCRPNGFGYDFVVGVMPDSNCPSDFDKNQAVAVHIFNMGMYIPGQNAPNIKIKVYGSAMFNNGDECVATDIVISGSDCIDGFDSDGNPCGGVDVYENSSFGGMSPG